jgi:hypothetical protein
MMVIAIAAMERNRLIVTAFLLVLKGSISSSLKYTTVLISPYLEGSEHFQMVEGMRLILQHAYYGCCVPDKIDEELSEDSKQWLHPNKNCKFRRDQLRNVGTMPRNLTNAVDRS